MRKILLIIILIIIRITVVGQTIYKLELEKILVVYNYDTLVNGENLTINLKSKELSGIYFLGKKQDFGFQFIFDAKKGKEEIKIWNHYKFNGTSIKKEDFRDSYCSCCKPIKGTDSTAVNCITRGTYAFDSHRTYYVKEKVNKRFVDVVDEHWDYVMMGLSSPILSENKDCRYILYFRYRISYDPNIVLKTHLPQNSLSR